MSYAWLITHDFLDGPQHGAVGTCGPSGASADLRAIRDAGERFRLKDGDDEVLFEGLFLGDASSEDGFGPLDDFGEPYAGCTAIEYFESGEWRLL